MAARYVHDSHSILRELAKEIADPDRYTAYVNTRRDRASASLIDNDAPPQSAIVFRIEADADDLDALAKDYVDELKKRGLDAKSVIEKLAAKATALRTRHPSWEIRTPPSGTPFGELEIHRNKDDRRFFSGKIICPDFDIVTAAVDAVIASVDKKTAAPQPVDFYKSDPAAPERRVVQAAIVLVMAGHDIGDRLALTILRHVIPENFESPMIATEGFGEDGSLRRFLNVENDKDETVLSFRLTDWRSAIAEVARHFDKLITSSGRIAPLADAQTEPAE